MKGQGRYPRSSLRALQGVAKRLTDIQFTPHKKRRFPAPWQNVAESRRSSTCLMEVASGLHVAFIARTGPSYEAKCLYGCLFAGDPSGPLTPLVRMDWHPSHKGLHAVFNCEDVRDFKGRGLTGCKELALERYRVSYLDPDSEQDRLRFVEIFCDVCNIALGEEGLF